MGRVACVHCGQGGRGRKGQELAATSFAFYAAFGMFIVNLLKAILSHKQMLHFTSASSRGLKTALINELQPEFQLQLQLQLQPASSPIWICICLLARRELDQVASWGCARANRAGFDFEWVRFVSLLPRLAVVVVVVCLFVVVLVVAAVILVVVGLSIGPSHRHIGQFSQCAKQIGVISRKSSVSQTVSLSACLSSPLPPSLSLALSLCHGKL